MFHLLDCSDDSWYDKKNPGSHLPRTATGPLPPLCGGGRACLAVPALYFGGDALLFLLRAPGLAPYLILVPPIVFISGVFLALNYWNSRTKRFGRLSVARVACQSPRSGVFRVCDGRMPHRREPGGGLRLHGP